MLSAIESSLQWLEQDLSDLASPEGITLDAVRDSISEMRQEILRDLFDQLSEGDPDCGIFIPNGFAGASRAFHEQCNQLGAGGLLVMAVAAIDGCRLAIEHDPSDHAVIVNQLCVATRMHERFQNLLIQKPALREAWAELQSENQSKRAAHAAKSKHAIDPRRQEKAFVKAKWAEWQDLPSKYRSKAAFASAVLKECKHLVSTKKIEDWCREWEKL